MCTLNNSRGRPFSSEGCQVPVGKGICGETRTLDIVHEFKRLYEEKMQEIDTNGGGDCLQEKFKLQKEWIGVLTEQNEMLVRAVEELEHEATERVKMLEEKLQQSAQCICEVMKRYRQFDSANMILEEPLKRIFNLENDQKNLLEFIRRIREEKRWTTDGLVFYELNFWDILGDNFEYPFLRYPEKNDLKVEKKVIDKEGTINQLEAKIDYVYSFGDVEELSKDLKIKIEECNLLKQAMVDMRHALTEEVASKHDTILQLKRDYQDLEERCIQADKQTAFRDDIIKELRKEIKHLKQQEQDVLMNKVQLLKEQVVVSRRELEIAKYASVENLNNKLLKALEKWQNVQERKENRSSSLVVDKHCINEYLLNIMAMEIERLYEIIDIKDCQLREQLLLVKVFVARLFKIDTGLQYLEARTISIKCLCLENKNADLSCKVKHLEDQKCCLESNFNEGKVQIVQLERQFKIFLKNKAELKQKYKASEKFCGCLKKENDDLKIENEDLKKSCCCLQEQYDNLKIEIEDLKKNLQKVEFENEKCCTDKRNLSDELDILKDEIQYFKGESNEYANKANDRTNENLKITNEMIRLSQENRILSSTVDSQKRNVVQLMKVNQEEIMKLNQTIDELKNTLQATKHMQEDEEKKKKEEITRLNHVIEQLKDFLKEIEEKYQKQAKICKICRANPKVGFVDSVEVQTNLNENGEQMEVLQKRNDIIKVETDTLKMLQDELKSLKNTEAAMREEKERQSLEIQQLKIEMGNLQNALQDSESKASNLQMAVDLYINSINVLEASEEKYKIEIDQQKVTISNLQTVLVAVKQELDELKSKTEDEEEQNVLVSNCVSLTTNEWEKENLMEQFNNICSTYRKLQDLNFNLEMEHCESLQDVDVLENQLLKYQHLLRFSETDSNKYKNHIKKLLKQKKCYEEVIIYFREEMTLMTDQLHNLQELLTLSNESVQEENSNLMQAFLDVQTANEKLARQLCAAEQTVLLENQMNQLNESKINELEKMISEKEIDLGRHDRAILNIRETLKCSMKQNEELHGTIVALNGTICQLQCAIKQYEMDNCKSKESTLNCQSQITACKKKLQELKSSLDEKTTGLCKLEMAYNNQNRCLQSAQIELKEVKEKQKDKQGKMRLLIEELKEKLSTVEGKMKNSEEDNEKLQNHLALLIRRETVKDVEIKRYRKIIGDLKKTLIDLNKALTNQKFQSKCNNVECKNNLGLTGLDEQDFNDICLNCPCEVEFYQSLVETLKGTVLDLKAKLLETLKNNELLEEEKKQNELQLEHLSKSQIEKEREYNSLRQKLTEKLKQAQIEETRYSEQASQFERELGSLRQELDLRTMQLNDVKKNCHEIHSSRCVQLACAQEEVSTLKEELDNLLKKHCALNVENEKLHDQNVRMQSTVSALEKKSQLLTSQLAQYLADLQTVHCEKEGLVQKNRELLTELRTLQSSYACADKQQRYINECVKQLENELFKVKASRDDICVESKNVINCFRGWLEEQKRINEYIINKEKNYVNTIEKLRHNRQEIKYQHCKQSQRPWDINLAPCRSPVTPTFTGQSPWSLESQGSTSVQENSPSRSPCMNEDCDWYSNTFKNDSEEDEEEEDWVSRVEDLAAQVRRTNKIWKNKMANAEHAVTKDQKK